MSLTSKPVRAVVLHGAIGAIGGDDEVHTSLELQGFTAAWLPGDHGICLIVGGGVLDGVQIEPAVTVVLPSQSPGLLARTISRAQAPAPKGGIWEEPAFGTTVGANAPAEDKGYRISRFGHRAIVTAYKTDPAAHPFPGKTHVIAISVEPFRFRVYLTKDEVADLKVVLRYRPSW